MDLRTCASAEEFPQAMAAPKIKILKEKVPTRSPSMAMRRGLSAEDQEPVPRPKKSKNEERKLNFLVESEKKDYRKTFPRFAHLASHGLMQHLREQAIQGSSPMGSTVSRSTVSPTGAATTGTGSPTASTRGSPVALTRGSRAVSAAGSTRSANGSRSSCNMEKRSEMRSMEKSSISNSSAAARSPSIPGSPNGTVLPSEALPDPTEADLNSLAELQAPFAVIPARKTRSALRRPSTASSTHTASTSCTEALQVIWGEKDDCEGVTSFMRSGFGKKSLSRRRAAIRAYCGKVQRPALRLWEIKTDEPAVYNPFPKEHLDIATGKMKLRGVVGKRLDFRIKIPFRMRKVDPWFGQPGVQGAEQKRNIDHHDPNDVRVICGGQGVLARIQHATGARILIPKEEDEGCLSTVIRSRSIADEWRALWACQMIANAASEHEGMGTLAIEIQVLQTVDDEESIVQPAPDIELEDSWPQTAFSVKGNLYATGSGPGVHYSNSALLITNDFLHAEYKLDYVCFRAEMQNGSKLPVSDVESVLQQLRAVRAMENSTLRATAVRLVDGIIVSGIKADATAIYLQLSQVLDESEKKFAYGRIKLPALPSFPSEASPACPPALLPCDAVNYPSGLMHPAKYSPSKQRKAAQALAATFRNTRDIVEKENADRIVEEEARKVREAEAKERRAREEAAKPPTMEALLSRLGKMQST